MRLASLFVSLSLFATAVFSAESALAWGRHGHETVCEVAAYLVAKDPKHDFLRQHGFDLGYYCNVPDLIWKKPATYDVEWTNHFMDMEIFERELKPAARHQAFELDRVTFNSTYPNIKNEAGRSFWRSRELLSDMGTIATELKKTDLSADDRHAKQADWLVRAGALGHYIGDLAQPLHVTENYDGQMTDQKGIHAYFEDTVVDDLYLREGQGLQAEVFKAAEAKVRKLGPAWAKKTPLEVMEELATQSNQALAPLLKLDKKIGRKDLAKSARAYHDLIVDRMAAGSIALASLWNRELDWDYDGKRFFNFVGAPDYIYPPKAKSTSAAASSAAASPAPAPAASPVAK